jgi:hypothetical protein
MKFKTPHFIATPLVVNISIECFDFDKVLFMKWQMIFIKTQNKYIPFSANITEFFLALYFLTVNGLFIGIHATELVVAELEHLNKVVPNQNF